MKMKELTAMTAEERAVYIDLDDGLGRVRGNKKLYKRMLGLFTASGEFAAFEDALGAGDIARAGEVAHGLKGMAGNLGLTKVFAYSTQLNAEMRGGTRNDALIADYREALAKTLEAVQELSAELE
jgi:HPt (histidine-containing phosphotransfer) domain-containing protein